MWCNTDYQSLSDFHKMIVSVMKTAFQKLKPRIVQYINFDYIQFSDDSFRKKLLENLSLENVKTNSNGLEKVLQICTLDQMTPRKKKYIRVKNMLFFNKKSYLLHTKKEHY